MRKALLPRQAVGRRSAVRRWPRRVRECVEVAPHCLVQHGEKGAEKEQRAGDEEEAWLRCIHAGVRLGHAVVCGRGAVAERWCNRTSTKFCKR